MHNSIRMQLVQTPIIPVVGDLIKANPGTISLGQGVVNYGPPKEAIDEIQTFLADSQNHKYKLVHGIPELLDIIETKLADENGIVIDDNHRIVVTAGGNMGFMNAILAISDPGDEIIIQTPYYFNHEMAINIADCKAVCVSTDADYQLQLDSIKAAITDHTRAIVTVSPNNPTGAVYSREALIEVNDLCCNHGIYHITDEAYEYFTYNGNTHFSPASLPDSAERTISLFSLSKAYGFASWRIGYMVIPEHLFTPIKKIQDTILICPTVISQWAAIGALRVGADYCREKLKGITSVRNLMLEKFVEIKNIVTIPSAEGAFYFLLRVHTDQDSMRLVEALIRDFGVAVLPGTTFGIEDGCYLRVAYGALEKDTVADGAERLVRGLKALVK